MELRPYRYRRSERNLINRLIDSQMIVLGLLGRRKLKQKAPISPTDMS